MRMLNPPHPGDFIRTEIIEPRGLSVTAAAQLLLVSRPALSSLLNGKAGLSGDMALRIVPLTHDFKEVWRARPALLTRLRRSRHSGKAETQRCPAFRRRRDAGGESPVSAKFR